jgi:hypothetical protein
MNAVVDALSPLGVARFDTPATPRGAPPGYLEHARM